MSKIKSTFFGGAEKQAGKAAQKGFQAGAAGIGAATTAGIGDIGAAIKELQDRGKTTRGLFEGGTERQLVPLSRAFGAAQETFQPIAQAGQGAFQMQAALSGALGPEAQQLAFQNFQEDPGTQFLRSEGERSLTNQAAALGQVGGGNIRRELLRFGQGLANQQLQSRFGNLQGVSGPGLQATSNIAGLQQGLGAAESGLIGQEIANLAGLESSLGANIANLQASKAGIRLSGATGQAGQLGAAGQAKSQGILGQAAGLRRGAGQAAGAFGGFTGAGGQVPGIGQQGTAAIGGFFQ